MSSICYYAADTLIKFYDHKFPEHYLDICRMSFLIHHIFTVFSFKAVSFVDHYTWYIIGPTAFHTVLVALPDIPINYPVYLFFVGAWMYNLSFKPHYDTIVGRVMCWCAIPLMIPIAVLYFGNCMSDFDYNEQWRILNWIDLIILINSFISSSWTHIYMYPWIYKLIYSGW